MILVDSDVLIEVLRGSESAASWIQSYKEETFAIPGIVAMELLVGCRNSVEMNEVRRFLAANPVVWPDAADFERAFSILETLRLSCGLSIPDSLIAAMALNRGARLYTFNGKHFRSVPGLDAHPPYPRRQPS